jgi:trimeric autotransporter adhesin
MKTFLLVTILLGTCSYSSAQSIGGIVGGSTTVCSGTNSGLLTLSGQTGNVVRWQSSTTSGASWSNISNTTVNLAYSNLSSTTWYRAEVLLSPSPPNIADYSVPAIVTVDAASSAIINSSTSVCYGSNSGMLSLSGIFTNVAGWDSSTDASVNWAPISNITSDQYYANLTLTTAYRARVKNGVCPIAHTPAATITVNPLSIGGTVLGATTVCSGSNSGALTLVGNIGNVIRWQSSTDGGVSWSNISSTSGSSTCNFSNITVTTDFRAVIQNGVCPSANSLPSTVTVLPVSDGGSLSPTTYSACSGINNSPYALKGVNLGYKKINCGKLS